MASSPDSVWSNWAGNVTATPVRVLVPESVDRLAEELRRGCPPPIRVAGSGHSFVPLCAGDGGTLVSLERVRGVRAVDSGAATAEILAGTPLWQLGEPLLASGLALENMGDIDRQTLAGAVGTGTHGTGAGLGSLSTQVVALELVTAGGERRRASATEDPELFAAARVGLGTVGVITSLTLRLLPAYRLHERMWKVDFDTCMGELEERVERHRHFEVFYFPHEDLAAMKALDPTSREPDTGLPYDGARFEGERIDWSHRIFPSARERRFVELEYSVPAAHGPACLRALRDLLRQRHPEVRWPVEYRRLAADDIWLSTAQGRDVATLSVHQGQGLPYQRFFDDAERILLEHDGRPHWGKVHSLRAAQLASRYPYWLEHARVRRALDPEGLLLNPYLRELLEG